MGQASAAQTADVAPSLAYVGSAQCLECHAGQARAWQQSHHAASMQEANATTVLGNFNNESHVQQGETTRFFRRDQQYFVNTPGPDNQAHDYPIAYTFGIYPLQQYLVALPGGRLQALALAWDSRTKEQGGQRWFHLYPEAPLFPGKAPIGVARITMRELSYAQQNLYGRASAPRP